MAASMSVAIFISHSAINKTLFNSYALGYWHESKNCILVNCTSVKNNDFNGICQFLKHRSHTESRKNFQLLGLIYSSEKRKHFDSEFLTNYDFSFIIRVNKVSPSFHLERIFVQQFSSFDVTVVIYDGYSIAKSHLLPKMKKISLENLLNDSSLSFLVETCQNYMDCKCRECTELYASNSKEFDERIFSKLWSTFLCIVMWIISKFYRLASLVFNWCPEHLMRIVLLTTVGQQFHQRYLHCSSVFFEYKYGVSPSIKCKNLICAILIDLICGYLITNTLLNSSMPDVMLNSAILQTNNIVSSLQNLINWLMGVPAGLKLNIPLNNALGKFFLYHIYLWESYMMVVQPLFAFIFKMSTVIGVFGFTFVLSLLNDLMSLATIHIYCFYGYATRLYGYQVTSLSALWRLFRGKKWNPLRQRIDSYTYNVHQLYLGTLIFTVLLFLLPTVMVYYFVFTCLRILVLIIQGLMSRIINSLTIFPLYAFIARLLNLYETTGDVYFSTYKSTGVLTLSMQVVQIPYMAVIQATLPDLKKYQEILTWKEFLSSILLGKIVYPL